jgi:cation-transporting P-type ATPase E
MPIRVSVLDVRLPIGHTEEVMVVVSDRVEPASAVPAGRGLTAAEVRERITRGQTNRVAARTSRRAVDIVRANVFTRFNAILGTLFVAILVIGPVQDALFGFVILINTVIGIGQELRAKQTLDRLAILGQARPRVRRDGEVAALPPAEVVLDDLVELRPGDQLVVDGVVRAATGLEIDESLLTGEADPVAKRPGDGVLSGSFVVAGAGSYRATKVGDEAYAARLAQQAGRFTLTDSRLRAGIDQLLKWITWLFAPVAALTLYGQLRGNQSLTDTARGTVAALVPMVPEGLVLLTSVAFAVGVIRLAARRCLVRELAAVEGLARVDVVCTDKTGTLTETGLRIDRLVPLDPQAPADPATALAALAAADPAPNATLRAIAEAFPDRPGWTVSAVAPFSSTARWSGATFAGHGSWLLGAPDVLLPARHPAAARATELAGQGLRTLLLARTDQPLAAHTDSITPVALVALAQRVRSDAGATLEYFAAQDVAVKVLSGDSPAAVGAVAAQLRLPGAESPVDARDLPDDPAALADRLARASVFGRVNPAQKQHMVTALQADGHAVAMTGDGVNDVLALKEARIGVAMGAGSPAARAVAQIVLLDNAFAALPHVVAEGRRVIGNIERVASLFLIKTAYSTLLAVLVGAAGLPFPFLPRQLTLVGALTIGVPAFFLALAANTARAQPDLLARVLRRAVPIGTITAAMVLACYLVVRAEPGTTLTEQRTAAVLTLFLIALWALAWIARPVGWWKTGLITAMAGLFGLALVLPVGQQFFALDPTNPTAVLTALSAAAVGIVVGLLVSWLLSRPKRT